MTLSTDLTGHAGDDAHLAERVFAATQRFRGAFFDALDENRLFGGPQR